MAAPGRATVAQPKVAEDWFPVPRHRGQLVRSACPCCASRVCVVMSGGMTAREVFHLMRDGRALGRTLSCAACSVTWREEMWVSRH